MSVQIIQSLLEAKQAQADAKRREVEILDAEARGLQAALDALRQITPSVEQAIGPHAPSQARRMFIAGRSAVGHAPATARRASAGRQPGAISNRWKRHLLELYDSGDVFSKDLVAKVVFDREQRVMKPSEVQRVFENFSRYGHVKIVDDGLYAIPEEAVMRFRATLKDELDVTEEPDEGDDGEQALSPSRETDELHLDS